MQPYPLPYGQDGKAHVKIREFQSSFGVFNRALSAFARQFGRIFATNFNQ